MSENEPHNDNEFHIPHPTRKRYLNWQSLDHLPPSLVNDLRNWVMTDGTAASKLAALFAEYLIKKPSVFEGGAYPDTCSFCSGVSVITSKFKTIGVWKLVDIFDFIDGLGASIPDEVGDVLELFAE